MLSLSKEQFAGMSKRKLDDVISQTDADDTTVIEFNKRPNDQNSQEQKNHVEQDHAQQNTIRQLEAYARAELKSALDTSVCMPPIQSVIFEYYHDSSVDSSGGIPLLLEHCYGWTPIQIEMFEHMVAFLCSTSDPYQQHNIMQLWMFGDPICRMLISYAAAKRGSHITTFDSKYIQENTVGNNSDAASFGSGDDPYNIMSHGGHERTIYEMSPTSIPKSKYWKSVISGQFYFHLDPSIPDDSDHDDCSELSSCHFVGYYYANDKSNLLKWFGGNGLNSKTFAKLVKHVAAFDFVRTTSNPIIASITENIGSWPGTSPGISVSQIRSWTDLICQRFRDVAITQHFDETRRSAILQQTLSVIPINK